MSTLTPGAGLPFLPGVTFSDPTKQKFHVSQTLGFQNGYTMRNQPKHPIGGGIIELSVIEPSLVDTKDNTDELHYRDTERQEIAPFVPVHVSLDKKVLHFKGYFSEDIVESPIETERTRFVDLFYYLVDDSVSMTEPMVKNSGLTQGKFLTRQRLPIGEGEAVLHWTQLNVAIDLLVYAKRVRLYACDAFTREYLTSEGIEVNPNETCPQNAYALSRLQKPQLFTSPSELDKFGKFLTLDRIVLRFFAVWDDRSQLFGEARKFVIHFYMSDDTMELKEVHTANNGRDPFPTLVTRRRMPKIFIPKTFPSVETAIIQEKGNAFFEASDLRVGETINVTNREMLLYDADGATRKFCEERLGITQSAALDLATLFPKLAPFAAELPEYNGFGSLEDSEQNCKKIAPDRPKKNYIKMLQNGNEKLRFKAKMVTNRELDESRRFVIEIRLADDLIAIHEIPQRNSGIPSGRFLEPSRIAKPGSSITYPQYYGLNDFKIGNIVFAFSHRFQIIDCDEHVKTWLDANPGSAAGLDAEFLNSIRARFPE